jgi:hypothetical protein
MRNLMLLALLCCSFSLFAQLNIGYVSIKAGANMRERPDVNATVLEKIPYAAKLELNDKEESPMPVKTEGFVGAWRKVNYNGKSGYIVDTYLLPQPPPKSGIKTIKEYLAQIADTFGNELTVKGGTEEIGWQLNKQLFKNGAEWHQYQGYEYGSFTYFLPGFSMQQAFLLVRMLPEFEEVAGIKDAFPRESKKIKKDDTEYSIKVESESYTAEPWIKRIRIKFEKGAIYNFEMYEVDDHIVIFYGAGV